MTKDLQQRRIRPFYRVVKFDDLVKSHTSPFDKLRANGGHADIIDFIPFVVSLSNHKKTFYEFVKFDDLVKSHKSPFDKLRANGGHVEIIDFIPFVVSLSNHKKTFYRVVKFSARVFRLVLLRNGDMIFQTKSGNNLPLKPQGCRLIGSPKRAR